MPSDGAPTTPSRLAWLRSQGLGFVCGQLTVVLLAIGSVVLVATKDGASREVQVDDLRAFFTPWAWAHWWLYALVPVLTLYALNTVLCTWDAVLARVRRGTTELAAWGPTAIHVSFLLLLLAHLLNGVGTEEGAPVLVGPRWERLDATREARLVSVKREELPDGKPKSLVGVLEVRDASGAVSTETVGYNQPLSRGWGSSLVVLAQGGQRPGQGVISVDGALCTVAVKGGCEQRGVLVRLDGLEVSRRTGLPEAQLSVALTDGYGPRPLLLQADKALRVYGHLFALVDFVEEDVLLLRVRTAPGHPWALVGAVLMGLGLLMMGKRWV